MPLMQPLFLANLPIAVPGNQRSQPCKVLTVVLAPIFLLVVLLESVS